MKFSLSLALVSLALVVVAVFPVGLDSVVGKVLLALGAALLVSAGFRIADATRRSARRK